MPARQRHARRLRGRVFVPEPSLGGARARPRARSAPRRLSLAHGVYESVQPPSGQGKLLWHALGAKTVELINENVHVEVVRDDLDTLVMDADVLEDLLSDPQPEKKAKELEIKLIDRKSTRLNSSHPSIS